MGQFVFLFIKLCTPPIAKIICVKNVRAKVFCGITFLSKEIMPNIWKRLWVPFVSCLLKVSKSQNLFIYSQLLQKINGKST